MVDDNSSGISSSKCDFRLTFDPFTFRGRRAEDDVEWSGTAPGMNVRVGSDKCDWRIQARGDQADTRVLDGPGHFDVHMRRPDVSGRIASDKCDFRVSVQRPEARMRVDSDKCDWHLAAGTAFASSRITMSPEYLDLRSRARDFAVGVASDKCDFRVMAQRPGARMRIASDKCDWHITAHDQFASTTTRVSQERLEVHGRAEGFAGSVSSSKCDWRIHSRGELVSIVGQGTDETFALTSSSRGFSGRIASDKCDFRIATTTDSPGAVRLESAGPGAGGTISSSKCDWHVTTIGGGALQLRPEFDAQLASSKCDFRLNIEFGLTGGERIRIQAVSSSKCDFTIENLDELNRG